MNPKKPIITASEIGQFHYCSISWYLQKCGYKPKSENIKRGFEQHKKLGIIIDQVNRRIRKSRIIGFLGFILLSISVFFLLIEVIL